MLVPAGERSLRVVLVQRAIQNGDLRLKVFREELGRLVAGSQEIDVDASQGVVQEVRVCKANVRHLGKIVFHLLARSRIVQSFSARIAANAISTMRRAER